MNGYKNISVDLYNKEGDKFVTTIQSTKVIDGSAVVELKTINLPVFQKSASFYVKIKNPVSGQYLLDSNKKDEFGGILQISAFSVFPSFLAPTNNVVTKVGQVNANFSNIEPCQYTEIKLISAS